MNLLHGVSYILVLCATCCGLCGLPSAKEIVTRHVYDSYMCSCIIVRVCVCVYLRICCTVRCGPVVNLQLDQTLLVRI